MVGGGHPRVELRKLSSLLPHEETSKGHTELLVAELRRDGVQKDPLIVDRRTGVVLDGMHRLAALVELKAGHAVCAFVEYSSKGISVRRWARVYRAKAAGDVTPSLERLGFRRKIARAEATRRLERRLASVAAITAGGCFLSASEPGMESAFETVRAADSLASTSAWQQTFVTDDDIEETVRDDRNFVLLVCRIDKRDVLNAAKSRKLFPFKTSMHVIDPRPVAANIPVAELREGSTRSLKARLSAAKYTLLPPNSIYGGRKYKERLLRLSDH